MIKPVLDWKKEEIVTIYDELSIWSSYFGKFLLDNIPMQPHSKIVDLGSGTGFPLFELAQRFGEGCELIGVDCWDAAVQRVKDKIRILGLSNVKIQESDVSDLDLSPNSVDLFSSNLGLNNFSNKPEVVNKIYDTLRPGGYFAFTTNTNKTFQELHQVLEKSFKSFGIDTAKLKKQQLDRVSKMDITNLFQDSGLHIVDRVSETKFLRFLTGEAVFNYQIVRLGFLSNWLDLITPKLQEQIIQDAVRSIDTIVQKEGEFLLSIPAYYYCYQKPEASCLVLSRGI